ncbi:hypothetical protein [Oecophyllibacter saccharovorans]|uniref:hypothetical protein n=1 Tax=Oecophyllibacter saccharovorans TaxID=2558360 RepID=UPI00116F739B|nr:hypothetical protein [Oecophyllibacter saccharovorans]TPW36608.1 hypothetical protein E3203_02260 [Oecophyllibacter saccharovorans]
MRGPGTDSGSECRRARRIGAWLARLGSYLAHEGMSEGWTAARRAEFFAEMVRDVMAEGLPDEIWGPDALRYVRRRCEFFPSLKRLCDLLQEFSAPLRVADRRRREMLRAAEVLSAVNDAGAPLSRGDTLALAQYRAHQADGFRQLGADRGTSPEEAAHSQVGVLRQYFPGAFAVLEAGRAQK